MSRPRGPDKAPRKPYARKTQELEAHVSLRLPSWVADWYRQQLQPSHLMRRVLTQYARENMAEDLTTSTAKVSLPYEQDPGSESQGQGGSDPQA